MFMKVLRFILSSVLFPCCWAITISFYNGILSIRNISESGLLFILGALSYSIVHLLLFKLDFLYVLVHELSHVIATFFSGGKVKGIKVSKKEGSVRITKPNFFVILAPYLVPGYTLVLAILYFSLSFFINLSRFSGIFIFLVGFTLMFHLAYTADGMRGRQSDLRKAGYLFSISFIYIVNVTIVFGIISLLFGEVSFYKFIFSSFERSKDFYFSFWKQLFL